MSKLYKAKCEKCEHCKMISFYGLVTCQYLNATHDTDRKPKYCSKFQKRGKK